MMKIRLKWLKGMYLYTALGAGLLGLALLIAPERISAMLAMPNPGPVMGGIVGSCYAAFGVLALFGLNAPLRFLPILLLQLVYKSIWLGAVFLPLALTAQPAWHAWLFAAIFASYVIGDLFAIPFRYLFRPPAAAEEF